MGITKNDIELLIFAKEKLKISFDKTLTLGRMQLFVKADDLSSLLKKYDQSILKDKDLSYADPVLELIGASEVASIDYSNYEGASIVHDLNTPVSSNQHSNYDLIYDGGTIEHVFNFPIAIQNCIKMLKLNGHYIGISPINNQMGHGFYQFSPELYYRVFSEENGFEVKKMMVRIGSDLFDVKDPLEVKSRVELINSAPTSLVVIAKKNKEVDGFKTPQQSDYDNAWSISESLKKGEKRSDENKVLHAYRRYVPFWIKNLIRKTYNKSINRKVYNSKLGLMNPKYFKKTNLSD